MTIEEMVIELQLLMRRRDQLKRENAKLRVKCNRLKHAIEAQKALDQE